MWPIFRHGVLVMVLGGGLSLAVFGASHAEPVPNRVSLIRLLAVPEKYDGQLVQVAGYFVFEEENHSLYFSPDDADNGISDGGIELASFTSSYSQPSELRGYNRKYVSLVGIFHIHARSEWPTKAMAGISVMSLTNVRNIRTPPYRYCPPDCR